MAKRARAEQPLYRVWRSDETEEQGEIYGALNESAAARLHAEYCHRHRDGWEWSWPIVFHVRNSMTDKTTVVQVDREMVPEFIAGAALPIEMKPATHALRGGRAMCMDVRLDKPPGEWPKAQVWVDWRQWPTWSPKKTDPQKCKLCDHRVKGVVHALGEIGAGGS